MILSKGLHIRDGDWYMYEHGLQRINMIKVINIFLREKITLPCILKLFPRIVFFPQNYDKWVLIQSKVYICLKVKMSFINGSVLIRYDVLSNSICS